MSYHQALAAGRWQQLTLLEQLGNIGSEVGRTFAAKTSNQRQTAAERALELFDFTLADKRWHGRGNEIARSREVFCDLVFGDNAYQSDKQTLEGYFMQYA